MKICKCGVCGHQYEYCPTCDIGRNYPSWYGMFDTENCKKICEILSANSVGFTNAQETLDKLDANCDLTIPLTPSIVAHIARLRAEVAPVKEEVKKETVIEQPTKKKWKK